MSEQSLLNLVRRLEWSGYRQGPGSGYMDSGGDGRHYPACPVCKGVDPATRGTYVYGVFNEGAYGHRELCDMEYQLKTHRQEVSA